MPECAFSMTSNRAKGTTCNSEFRCMTTGQIRYPGFTCPGVNSPAWRESHSLWSLGDENIKSVIKIVSRKSDLLSEVKVGDNGNEMKRMYEKNPQHVI